ncbi:tetratricopeptide repeat protein [Planctomycetota bacterium]
MSQATHIRPAQSLSAAFIKPSHWIIGAREDLLLFLLTPLVLLALVLVAQHFWTMAALGVFATVLAMGHYLPGLMRAYGDPALFERFRMRFLLAPIFFIGTAMYMARGENEQHAFLIVVVLWGSWHWLMQAYGLVRIYDAKASNFDSVSARLDYALCILWFGVIYWQTDGIATVLARIYQTGVPIPSEAFIWLARVWLACTIGVSLFYVVHVVRRARAGRPPSYLKLAMLGITALFYYYAFGRTSSHLVAFTLFEAYHDIQYLAIVWVFNQSRVDKDANAGAFTKFLFRRRAPLIVLYVLLCLGFGSYRFFVDQVLEEEVARFAFGLITGLALVHFYFDGFIWRIRESSTSSTLGVSHAETGEKRRTLPRLQRHALLWAIIGIPVVGLGLYETYGRVPSDDIDRLAYEAVLKIRPASHKTHLMLSREYATSQTQSEENRQQALFHAARARELRPNYAVNDVQYFDLLLERPDELSTEQLNEMAIGYENAAKTRAISVSVLDNWGVVLQKLNQLPDSERVLQRAIAADPNNAEVRYHIAQVLAQQQKYQEAANACVEAVRIAPDHYEAHSMAATLLMQVGTPDLALPHFRRAIELTPDRARDKINLALALATVPGPLRNVEAAIALADEARNQIDPTDLGQALNLVQVYASCGQFEQAIEFADSAVGEFEKSGAVDAAASLRAISKQIREGLEQSKAQIDDNE